jgi:hypothetical protein
MKLIIDGIWRGDIEPDAAIREKRLEGVAATVDRQAILLHFYDDWRLANPRIAPPWPATDWQNVGQGLGYDGRAPA